MPLNINSGAVTPQNAVDSVASDKLQDKLNKNKIGDNQVLYSSGNGKIKGNTVHSWLKSNSDWKQEKTNAKNEVVEWIKGFGLSEKQTSELVQHVETKFSQANELRGSDLKEIAKLAQQQLKPFADKPFVCTKNASPKEVAKANLWLALNKDNVVGAKGNYQNGFTLAVNPKASRRDRTNVLHGVFSMSKLALKPEVLQQQMVRFRAQLPPLQAHELHVQSSEPVKPHDGATKKAEYNEQHDYHEAGRNEWKANPLSAQGGSDNMGDFVSQGDQPKRTNLDLGINSMMDDAQLLEILDDELGDKVEKMDINSDYLNSLRDMMYDDFSEVEVDYTNQLDNSSQYVSPMKSFNSPEIMEDDNDDLRDDANSPYKVDV